MRVLYVVPPGYSPDHPTGAAVHMREIIEGLRRHGAAVDVLQGPATPPGSSRPSPTGWVYRPLRDAGRLVHSYRLAAIGARMIRRHRPDAIYERGDYLFATAWLLARWYRLPRVLEVNGLYTDIRQFGWEPVSWDFTRRFHQAKGRSAARVIGVTEAMRDAMLAFGVPADRIVVLHNGARSSHAHPNPAAVSAVRRDLRLGPEPVLGFIGHVLPWHGVGLLIKSAAALRREGRDVQVLVVGGGDLIADLRDTARRLGMADRVTFTGAVPYERLALCVATMDICAIPRHSEGNSPLKLYDYGVAGKPIISVLTPGMQEVWTPGEHGLGIRNGNLADLTAAVRRYLRDPELRERHGRAFQRVVLAEHTWDRVAEQTLRVIEDAVHHGPRG